MLKKFLRVPLALALAVGSYAAPVIVPVGVATLAVTQTACDDKDVTKVKRKVEQAASILNTAARSNRELYRSGVYGAVGSAEAISKRQKVATALHEANEALSEAVEVAAQLQPGMSGKAVYTLLAQSVQHLVHLRVGNERIDVLIQTAVTAINSAIVLAQAIKEK